MTKAWHLRQDGKLFPVRVHMYCMEDDDLSSEAEVAAFIIKTNSKDQDIASYVLDAWMALLIENEISYDGDVDTTILETLQNLPYRFQYPLSSDELLAIHHKQDNYHDVDTLYEFTDSVRDKLSDIQSQIKSSINQQFCRVRYGGQYDSVAGNNEIWIRVSSVGFNWVDVIYSFVSSIKRSYHLSLISICRDSESDGNYDGKSDYFYKAKDGATYFHMPIEEYFEEEHEHNPVFESVDIGRGVIATFRDLLFRGETPLGAMEYISEYANVTRAYRQKMMHLVRSTELKKCEYVEFHKGLDIPSRIMKV